MAPNSTKLMEYMSEEFINKTKKTIKFLIIYTIGFFLLFACFKYAMPFVIAIIIAITFKPLKNRILKINQRTRKFKITNGAISLIMTILIVVILGSLVGTIIYQIFIQSQKFLNYATNPNTIVEITEIIDNFVNRVLASMKSIDPEIISKLNESIMELVKIITNLFSNLGGKILKLAVSIPSGIITVFITLISTYFFTKDIEKIQSNVKGMFSEKGLKFLRDLKRKLNNTTIGYIKAYLLIIIAIASISTIIYLIAGVEYAVPIGILTAVLDFLPLIGAGLVFGVLIIIEYFSGNTIGAVILIIGYIIVAIIRQLLEQNLVASFIGVHPLVMIIGLFIALTSLGFAGMFYFLGAFILYDAVIN